MRGMFMGLTLDSGVGDLATKFHVTLEVSSSGLQCEVEADKGGILGDRIANPTYLG
jgi:hypothetical protein